MSESSSATTGAAPASAFLTSAELAQELGLAAVTLRQWRARGQGPAFTRMGHAIRYARADVDRWLTAHRVGGAS